MNSFGHLIISSAKSVIRLISCWISFSHSSIAPLAVGFAVAEILGILEELVDKR
jgi:hypothetical protein